MVHNRDTVESLRILPCLSGLRADELDSVVQLSHTKKIQKDTVLFQESEAARSFFIVKSGSIKLFKISPEGRELVVKILGPGDHFCCAPLYAGDIYFVSAVAVENSSVMIIPSAEFKDLIRKSVGEIGFRIVTSLCNRVRYLSKLLEDLTFKDVDQRLIITLLRLAEEKSPEENLVSLSLTHNALASMIGTVREVVSRSMSKLKREGGISESAIRGFRVDKRVLSELLGGRYHGLK